MIWLVLGDVSFQIVGANLAERDGKYQVWVTRPSEKSTMIYETENKDDAVRVKQNIDLAVEMGEKTITI